MTAVGFANGTSSIRHALGFAFLQRFHSETHMARKRKRSTVTKMKTRGKKATKAVKRRASAAARTAKKAVTPKKTRKKGGRKKKSMFSKALSSLPFVS